MDAEEVIKNYFWETISEKGQLEIAIESIERWLKKPDSTVCPFGKGWKGSCSLCITLFEAFSGCSRSGCPCFVHGKEYTIARAKEVLQMLKSLLKERRDDGEVHK